VGTVLEPAHDLLVNFCVGVVRRRDLDGEIRWAGEEPGRELARQPVATNERDDGRAHRVGVTFDQEARAWQNLADGMVCRVVAEVRR
jgi:hypothetical protein